MIAIKPCLVHGKVDMTTDIVDPSYGTRAEHLKWCKTRALELVDLGELIQAYTSMMSDMRKHPSTADHAGLDLGMSLLLNGHLATPKQMREFIEGFN